MKKLLFVSVLFFVLKGYSQDTIVNFLNNKRNIVLKDNASLIQVIIKKDTAVLENLYWAKTRKLKSFGHYLDNKLTTKIGKFEYYDKDGALEIIESYNKKGFRQGKYLSFKNKKKRTIGVYNNGKRNGMWNFYDDNGIKYSHIINPKTGMPINHSTKSVTVVEESSMLADGWATALLAMGSLQGLKIAEKENIAVLFIDKTGKELIKIKSTKFQSLK